MPTSFSQWGGARIGADYWLAFSMTWPFAWIEVAPDRLEFGVFPWYLLGPWVFTPSTVRRLSIYTGLLRPGSMMRASRYLRIEHGVRGYPAFLLFYSFNLPRLATELARYGFLVEET